MSQSLSGQLYLDPKDSGDLLMFVCDPMPDSDRLEVTPVGLHRMWPRGRASVLPLIADFKTHKLPKMRNALLAAADSAEQLRACDVDRVLALAKDFGIAEVTICQWLLSYPLLMPRTARILEEKAGLGTIVCPDCNSNKVAGPDEDGFFDCQDCGLCFENPQETP